MILRLIASLLMLSVMSQAWAVGDMFVMSAEGAAGAVNCAGQVTDGDQDDCCRQGAPMGASCEVLCNATAAPPPAIHELFTGQASAPLELLPAARAGPRDIPLNPPPIS